MLVYKIPYRRALSASREQRYLVYNMYACFACFYKWTILLGTVFYKLYNFMFHKQVIVILKIYSA